MAFRFRLQVVLEQALRVQDQKAGVLAKAQLEHQAQVAALERLRAEDRAHRDQLIAIQQSGHLDVQEIQWGLGSLATLERRMAAQGQVIQRALDQVEAARADLMEAARKVSVLEKLKTKARQDYQAHEDLVEARFIDELATMRHGRGDALNSEP